MNVTESSANRKGPSRKGPSREGTYTKGRRWAASGTAGGWYVTRTGRSTKRATSTARTSSSWQPALLSPVRGRRDRQRALCQPREAPVSVGVSRIPRFGAPGPGSPFGCGLAAHPSQ